MDESISGHIARDENAGGSADSSSRDAILTTGLTRDFPGVRALDGLSLCVPRGSIFGFLGRNGAGKTTTIRLLLGLLRPTDGEARVLGFDTVTESDEIRRRCGVLLEQPGLLERLSAEANLDLYGRIARMPRAVRAARIEELLTRIGLWDRRTEPVRGWSRGMRQRLAIARALIHRPSLIFLDEPTAGLDPVSAAEVRDDLLRLAGRERVTVFLTTHNLAEAEKLCDQVAIVRDGRLLAMGPPADIGSRHTLRQVRFRGTGFNDNVAALLSDRRDVHTMQREEGGALVSLAENAEVANLVTFLVRVGVGVEEVSPVGNTLEDGVLSIFNDESFDELEAAGMNFLRDVWVVVGKEWTELRGSDSGWVTLSTLVVFLAIVGVFVPWQLGPSWIEAPWPVLIWAWIPFFIVTTVTSDSVAGERERRTLETLLATRLSDAAILWGKWFACVTWVWTAMLLSLPIGLLTLNLSVDGGLILPGIGQAVGVLAVAFAGSGLGAAAGVLVSLRSESVRHAQQVLAIGALVTAFVPLGILRLMPREWTAEVFQVLAYGSPTRVAWITATVLLLVILPILGVAQARFRRGRILLK